jgi:drug/metabolite transporter (DMT)-like permease
LLPFLHRRLRTLVAMGRRGWTALLLVSLTGGLVGTLAIVRALFLVDFHGLSVVVLLQKLQPLFAIGLASLLLRERLSRSFLAWSGAALAGAYLLAFGLRLPDLNADSKTATAALLATVAAAAFGSATVFGKQLVGSLDFTSATFGRFGVTTVLAFGYLVAAGHGAPLGQVTGREWLLILLISLTTGSGALFLYYLGLTRVRASTAAICELCLPLSAVLFDYLINGAALGPCQWLGAAVLIGAILRITAAEQRS